MELTTRAEHANKQQKQRGIGGGEPKESKRRATKPSRAQTIGTDGREPTATKAGQKNG